MGTITSLEKMLESVVEHNKALNNPFFDRCKNGLLDKQKLKEYLINFFPITEGFALNSFAYCDTISRVMQCEIKGIEMLINPELFLSKVIETTCGVEFHIGHNGKPVNFHYNAFARLAPKLGVSIEKMKLKNYGLHDEAIVVVENLKRNFRSGELLAGIANIFVIEFTALNIINSLADTFGRLKDENGERLYSSFELQHITLHQVLEIEHNNEAHDLIGLLNISSDDEEKLEMYVDELSRNLGKFWEKLNEN